MDQIVNLAMFTMDRTVTQSPQRCSEFLGREIKPPDRRRARATRLSLGACTERSGAARTSGKQQQLDGADDCMETGEDWTTTNNNDRLTAFDPGQPG